MAKKSTKQTLKSMHKTINEGANMVNDSVNLNVKGAVKHGKEFVKGIKELLPKKNHPEWYTKFGTPLTVPNFSQFRGASKAALAVETVGIAVPVNQCVPSTLDDVNRSTSEARAVTYVPDMWTAAINRIYAQINGSNASIVPFTPGDLGSYLESCRGILIQLAQLSKIIKSYNTVDNFEKGAPYTRLNVLLNNAQPVLDYSNVKWGEIVSNRAQLIDGYNVLVKQFEEMCPLPPDMSVYDRSLWLFGNIFRDDEDEYKANVISFNPNTILRVNNNNGTDLVSVGASNIAISDDGTVSTSASSLYRDITENIQLISSNTTFSDIRGYMYKAFGARSFKPLEQLTTSSVIKSIYDPQLIMQFANALTYDKCEFTDPIVSDHKIVNTYPGNVNNLINAAAGYSITINDQDDLVDISTPISSEVGKLDNGTVMSLTRLSTSLVKWYHSSVLPNAMRLSPFQLSTEVLGSIVVYYFDDDAILRANVVPQFITYAQIASTALPLSQITGAPRVFVTVIGDNVQYVEKFYNHFDYRAFRSLFGDLEITASYTPEQAQTLNRLACLSMYKTIDVIKQDNWKATK